MNTSLKVAYFEKSTLEKMFVSMPRSVPLGHLGQEDYNGKQHSSHPTLNEITSSYVDFQS